jgi:ABC-type transport system involved in multi-copper enzyme maturation permease subunit
MLRTIIRKELFLNIYTFRFAVGLIVCLILSAINTALLSKSYLERLERYSSSRNFHLQELREFKVYSQVRFELDRPPSKLWIFNRGVEEDFGGCIPVRRNLVPTILDMYGYGEVPPEKFTLWSPSRPPLPIPILEGYFTSLTSTDLTFLLQIILSLLALLFAYDAISGEREEGTLRLNLSNPIPKARLLIGKYLGAALTLFLIVASSFIIAVLIAGISGVRFGGEEISRIGLMMFASLLYLSAFYLIGLLVSIVSERSATSLIICLFIWVFLVGIYPKASAVLVDRFIKGEPPEAAFSRMKEIWREYESRRREYIGKIRKENPGISAGGYISMGGRNASDPSRLKVYREDVKVFLSLTPEWCKPSVDAAVEYYRKIYSYERYAISYAERAYQVRSEAIKGTFLRRFRIYHKLQTLSPAGSYANLTSALAQTDIGSMLHFAEEAREFRRQFIQYLYDKDAFNREEWFYCERRKPDLRGFPVFKYREEPLRAVLGRSFWDITALLLFNLLFFMLALVSFLKKEV